MILKYKSHIVDTDYYTNELVKQLKSDAVKERDVIYCISYNPIETIVQWLSCEKIGAIPCLVPTYFSQEQKQSLIDNLLPDYVLESKGVLIHNLKNYKNFNRDKVDLDGIVIHTSSATTGLPKMILRTRKQLEAEINRYIDKMNYTNDDVFIPLVPLYHAYGFCCSLLTSIKLNATLVIPSIIYPRSIIELCNDSKATAVYGVPEFFTKLLQVSNKTFEDNKKIKFISSSSSMDFNLPNKFYEKYGVRLIHQYGSTETGSLCISDENDEYNEFSVPFANVCFESAPVNDNIGLYEIYVNSKDTIGSYIRDNTLVHLNKKAYKTGDIGKITDKKLIINGRIDDVINISGKKVSKAYIENKVKSGFKNINKINIKTKEVADRTLIICEYLSEEILSEIELYNFCEKELPEYACPFEFIKIDD